MNVPTQENYWCENYNEFSNDHFSAQSNCGQIVPYLTPSPPSDCQLNVFDRSMNAPEAQQCVPDYMTPSYMEDGGNTSNMNYSVLSENVGFYSENMSPYPAPCHGPQPWNYAYCYGYYGEEPCQFSNVIDMEDFM